MNILENLQKLKDISDKLKQINVSMACPVVTSYAYQQQLSLQYDYFLDFIGLYEDTIKHLDEQNQTFETRRYKKELTKFWENVNEI